MVPKGLWLSNVAAKSHTNPSAVAKRIARPRKPTQVKRARIYRNIHQRSPAVHSKPNPHPKTERAPKVPRRWNCSDPKKSLSKLRQPTKRTAKLPPVKRTREKANSSDATRGKIENIRISTTAGARNTRPMCLSSHWFMPLPWWRDGGLARRGPARRYLPRRYLAPRYRAGEPQHRLPGSRP